MTTNEILVTVEQMINEGTEFKNRCGFSKKWRIYDICEGLGIFDWWNEYLSVSQLKQMKSFLQTAIENGYTGYACFKVGAKGCSNGMWAYTKQSEDGYSPRNCDAIYHSFVSGRNEYSICKENLGWGDELTPAQFKAEMASRRKGE